MLSDRDRSLMERLTPEFITFLENYCLFLDAVKAGNWESAQNIAAAMKRTDLYESAKRLDEMCPGWYNQA